MRDLLQNILKALLSVGKDIIRNRLLNKNTSKGILILVGGAYGFGYLSEQDVNFLISLFSNSNISWVDIYITFLNILIMYLLSSGAYLIISKTKNINLKKNKKMKKIDKIGKNKEKE